MTKSERDEQRFSAIVELRKLLPAGSTVYGIIKSVSRSGMSRHVSFYAIKGNKPQWLDRLMARVGCAGSFDERTEDIRISGCGMDMIMHAVTTLAYNLYGDERALKYERV